MLKRIVISSLAGVLSFSLSVPAATAHEDRHRDPNDVRGNFDIVKVDSAHARDRLRVEITLAERYRGTDIDLRLTRYFLIGVDLDQRGNDRRIFERCVFIVDRPSPKAIATDCGSRRYGDRDVGAVDPRTLGTTLDLKRMDVDGDFRFAVISYWGDRSCPNDVCVDAAPNRLPLYLEDRTKPTIGLQVPGPATEPSFDATFTIKDGKGSGIARWVLEQQAAGTDTWEVVATGKGEGTKSRTLTPGGGAWTYRVTATDKQGNVGVSAERQIGVPYDAGELASIVSYGGSVTTLDDGQMFGGTYVSMPAGSSFAVTLDTVQVGTFCPRLRFYGPSTGDWHIDSTVDGGSGGGANGQGGAGSPREQFFTIVVCPGEPRTVEIEVASGSGFGFDFVTVEDGSIVP